MTAIIYGNKVTLGPVISQRNNGLNLSKIDNKIGHNSVKVFSNIAVNRQ